MYCWEDEEWRPVAGFDMYEISNFGRVYTYYKHCILKPNYDQYGYLRVDLYRDRKAHHRLIHRLVAMAFSNSKDYTLQINHIDGDKTYNVIENLEWVTLYENVAHAVDNGFYEGHKKAIEIIEIGKRFDSLNECAKYLNVDPSTICHAVKSNNNRTDTVKGYTLRYVD